MMPVNTQGSRISTRLFKVSALLVVLSNCAPEPAFMEQARNINADDMLETRTRASEGDALDRQRSELPQVSPVEQTQGGTQGTDGGSTPAYKDPGSGNENCDDPTYCQGGTQPVAPKPEPKPGDSVALTVFQEQGKIDILWIVDNSGSMAWAQSELAGKFEAFAKKLVDARLDFRVGVTTTDVCQINWSTGAKIVDDLCPVTGLNPGGQWVNGKMVGPLRGEFIADPQTGNKVLSPGTDFVSTFRRIATVGTKGSGAEHGLTAARLAIEKSMSGVNSGFLRKDAYLSVVVLSDEEDDGIQFWCEDAWGRTTRNTDGEINIQACSDRSSPYSDQFGNPPYALLKKSDGTPLSKYKFTADDFVKFLGSPSVKGEGKFRVSAITGIRGKDGRIDCSNPNVPSSAGPKEEGSNYIKAAELSNGIVENICSDNWSGLLSNIGQNVTELVNRFELPQGKIPFPGTMEVRIDGKRVPDSNFTWEEKGNFLVFKVTPPQGAEIKIVYKETVL